MVALKVRHIRNSRINGVHELYEFDVNWVVYGLVYDGSAVGDN